MTMESLETLKEAHERTGCPLTTLRNAAWAGAIAIVSKRGNVNWVRPSDVDAWLERQYGPARDTSGRGRWRYTRERSTVEEGVTA